MTKPWFFRLAGRPTLIGKNLLLFFVAIVACSSPDEPLALKEALPPISQTFLYVSDGSAPALMRIQVATVAAGDLALCVVQPGTKCTPQTQTALTEIRTVSGRRFLAPAQEISALPGYAYRLVKQSGDIVSEHRLIDRSGTPIDAGLSLVDRDTLRRELGTITADAINGRLSATPENAAVADWLISHLQRVGVPPVSGADYRQRFELSVGPTKGSETANIVGLIEGTDPVLKNEYVVVGAHMDHAGTLARGYTCSQSGQSDSICNGADDNGSGTIALLNVTKALMAARSSLKRSVVIIWFSGEEEGLLIKWWQVWRISSSVTKGSR